jgi:hypothetical protein
MRLIGLAVVLAIVFVPLTAEAQKSEKMARVGILGIGPTPSPQELAKSGSANPFWRSMRQLGWVDGTGAFRAGVDLRRIPCVACAGGIVREDQ